MAQTEAQNIFGIGLELGLAEYNSLADNNINLIEQYLTSAQGRARDNNCVNASDISNLRDRLRRVSSGRTRADIIIEFRNNLYNNLQNCDCSSNGNIGTRSGTSQVNNSCNWRVNFGQIYDRGDHIYTKAPSDGSTSYFIACNQYLGDWRSYRNISFDKRSWGGDFYRPDPKDAVGDIILRNGNMTATIEISPEHSGEWRNFVIPLNAREWVLSGGAYTIQDVLRNVTDFRIRAEYGAGVDHAAIRNVVLR